MTVETQIHDQLFELQAKGFSPTHVIMSEPMAAKFIAEMRDKHNFGLSRPLPVEITDLKDFAYAMLKILVKSNCELTYLEVMELI